MKKQLTTALAVTMSAVLLLSGCGTAVYAEDTDQETASVSEEEETSAALQKDTEEGSAAEAPEEGKQQNVYVLSKADGTVDKVYENGSEIEASDLPVRQKVTYTLDGKEISAEDLKGKSGH